MKADVYHTEGRQPDSKSLIFAGKENDREKRNMSPDKDLSAKLVRQETGDRQHPPLMPKRGIDLMSEQQSEHEEIDHPAWHNR